MDDKFNKKVKTWLVINDLKQKDLAEMLGISSPYLSDILLGKRKGKKVKQKIIKLLDIKEAS
ncbi:transcriptional regulator [Bacillus toyonensis]|uniref:helix-turn-helix domain-containing protein n=1 Tax=Bacillus toyonensis TaxID=155322 RepID=UPI000BF1C5F2|nr:helix-turn-helix domain-containing protein [Bacillus toyonensis]PEJ20456.1 transcriptional regulator [Bacillus toyonensis]PEM89498.1 transcriptional regulator [Bacillus toyonensis]